MLRRKTNDSDAIRSVECYSIGPLSARKKSVAPMRSLHVHESSELIGIWRYVSSGAHRLRWFLSLSRHIFVSEVCSLAPRIRYRFDERLDSLGVDLGPSYQKLPADILCRVGKHKPAFMTCNIGFPIILGPRRLTSRYIWRAGIWEKDHRWRRLTMLALN